MSDLQARNEMVIDAPISKIWAIITDINQLTKVNPGIVSATGRMDMIQSTRTCEIDNQGKRGTLTERLIELVPEKKTVWSLESDTMGMSKMLKEVTFCFNLEKMDNSKTRVINETYYTPAHFIAKIMNAVVMKRMIAKAQKQILNNIKRLTEI